jgi:putative membrane protein
MAVYLILCWHWENFSACESVRNTSYSISLAGYIVYNVNNINLDVFDTCLRDIGEDLMALANRQDSQSIKGQTSERDLLAEHRTTLANERTLMAFTRTALAFFIVGCTLIKFFGYPLLEAIGWVFIPIGVVIMGKGIASFRSMKKLIDEEKARKDSESS